MNIVQVLGTIVVCDGKSEVIEDILGMEEGELELVLRGLSSLMEFEDENRQDGGCYAIPDFDFAHASFSDYLSDSSRSGPFHVNEEVYEDKVTIRSFALITQSIRSSR